MARASLTIGLLGGALAAQASLAVDVPDGFEVEQVARGFTGATAMAIVPDGRILVCEQTGGLRVVKDGAVLASPLLEVAVDSYWERGLIGVTLDPRFPGRPFVYIVYVAARPHPHHVVSRFRLAGDRAVPGSEVVLLEGDDQTKLGGSIPAGHQGGVLRFGKDGCLYVGIGEQTAGEPSQRLDTLQGKLLRLRADGSIPQDNPFFAAAQGKYRATYALGLRNPFGLAVDPASGRMLVNDVGGSLWEEVDEVAAGANYGWPRVEGPSADPRFRAPLHAYERSAGKSITGGAFCRPPGGAGAAARFPERHHGRYFFADFEGNWIHTLDLDRPRDVEVFATGLARPVDVCFGPDGALYVLERNAWVNDSDFRGETGSLIRIRFSGKPRQRPRPAAPSTTRARGVSAREPITGVNIGLDPAALPAQLSRTGLFRSLGALSPSPGIVPYEVNSPLWADGASKRRWIAPPAGEKIGFAATGSWRFPAGTIFIKHFELARDASRPQEMKRLETRVLVVGEPGQGYGATYRWREDESDADLLDDAVTAAVPCRSEAGEARSWYFPSRKDCLTCHTELAGFVLGASTRQLNLPARDPAAGPSENQLLAWSRLGMLSETIDAARAETLERLAPLDDASAPLETRVRSYLDSNCANCHRPGGSRSLLDLRFEVPLEKQLIVHGPLLGGDLGIPGARVVVPGSVERSALHQRFLRRDAFRMPPLAVSVPDREAMGVIEEWIRKLEL